MCGCFSCCDFPDDGQAQWRILARVGDIFGTYGVAVHGRIVEPGQVDRGDNILTNVQADRIENVLAEGTERAHAAEQILAMGLHRSKLTTIRFRRLGERLELWRAGLRFVGCLTGEQRHAAHSNAAQL